MKNIKKLVRTLFVVNFLIMFLMSSVLVYAQPLQKNIKAVAAQATTKDSYSLPLFTTETVMKNPNSAVYSYLTIHEGSQLSGNAVLDLWFSYSPITIPDLSTITVSVNGVPVTSKKIFVEKTDKSNWKVQIPANYFKSGINEIGINVVHRTIDGLCRDVDNAANWFIIKPESRINFTLTKNNYTLADFPRPFLDDYVASKINTVVYIPQDADKHTLDAVMMLASGLGKNGLLGSLPTRMEIRFGEPGQVEANEIVFGSHDKWHKDKNYPADAPMLTLEQLKNGFNRLLITGDSKDFVKAVQTIIRPQLVKTLFTKQVLLNSELPPEPKNLANAFYAKKDLFTIADLGYNDIPVAGAFHQDAYITIPRPANYKLGKGAFIELKFRHSKILDPKKSAVTIYINDIPIKAVALMLENAEKGILRAEIPESQLDASSWFVRFGFYHDLGIIDCSKRYDEVAWSVIEKETLVSLKAGNILYNPQWENFPNDFNVTKESDVELHMLIGDRPNAQELTAAFKLAYYIGAKNRGKINWDVQSIEKFDAQNAKGTVIALGDNNSAQQWGKLNAYLPVAINSDNTYKIADWVEIVPDVVANFDVCQIGKIDNEKYIYAFMYRDISSMNQLMNFIIQKSNPLKGQVSFVDPQGDTKSYYNTNIQATTAMGWIEKITNSLGGTTGIYIIAIVVVLIATSAVTLFSRKK